MAHVCYYVCCVAGDVKIFFLALECSNMLCVCVADVMDAVFSVVVVVVCHDQVRLEVSQGFRCRDS